MARGLDRNFPEVETVSHRKISTRGTSELYKALPAVLCKSHSRVPSPLPALVLQSQTNAENSSVCGLSCFSLLGLGFGRLNTPVPGPIKAGRECALTLTAVTLL